MSVLSSLRGPQTPATFSFLKHEDKFAHEKPYYYNGPLATGQEALRSNFGYEVISNVPVTDIRGSETQLTLEEDGVEVVNFTPRTSLAAPWESLPIQTYLDEVAAFVKQKLQAQHVLAYNYKVSLQLHSTRNQADSSS